MLIRRGKDEGWLSLSLEDMHKWATASGIKFVNATPALVPGRGTGLLAQQHLHASTSGEPVRLLELSEDLVLSVEAVKRHASFDADFRDLLDSLGEFGRSPRGAILSFLLFQASIACPNLSDRVGVHGPFTDYVRALPCELLPTFWEPEELQLLLGTTLAPALASKLRSLRREYDLLCSSAAGTRWFTIVGPHLDFDDWLQVDAMFRSRALDFHGSCMIPGIDLASHAPGETTNSFYDRRDGTYALWLLPDKDLNQGDEVTITYGDEKGACEMLFSYGFLDAGIETAETLFLDLNIPEDDTARGAKMKIAQCAPGFKLVDVDGRPDKADTNDSDERNSQQVTSSGTVDWSGDFVWLLCVGYDDGLRFELARTVDGGEELQATFRGDELLNGASDLRRLLAGSDLWPVYRLRAIVLLQQRVFNQLQTLYSSQDQVEAVPRGGNNPVREVIYQQALALRQLEWDLIEKAYEDFERQKIELAESPVVKDYLAHMNDETQQQAAPEEDFS